MTAFRSFSYYQQPMASHQSHLHQHYIAIPSNNAANYALSSGSLDQGASPPPNKVFIIQQPQGQQQMFQQPGVQQPSPNEMYAQHHYQTAQMAYRPQRAPAAAGNQAKLVMNRAASTSTLPRPPTTKMIAQQEDECYSQQHYGRAVRSPVTGQMGHQHWRTQGIVNQAGQLIAGHRPQSQRQGQGLATVVQLNRPSTALNAGSPLNQMAMEHGTVYSHHPQTFAGNEQQQYRIQQNVQNHGGSGNAVYQIGNDGSQIQMTGPYIVPYSQHQSPHTMNPAMYRFASSHQQSPVMQPGTVVPGMQTGNLQRMTGRYIPLQHGRLANPAQTHHLSQMTPSGEPNKPCFYYSGDVYVCQQEPEQQKPNVAQLSHSMVASMSEFNQTTTLETQVAVKDNEGTQEASSAAGSQQETRNSPTTPTIKTEGC